MPRYVPPWKQPYLIGIAGCSGSGKTSIASSVIHNLNVPWTVLLSMDNFYKPLSAKERERAFASEYDFDCPEAIDIDMLVQVLRDLKTGKKAQIPTYSFNLHNRTDKWLTLYGANVIIIEGIYALYDPRVIELLDLKVFVDTDFDICLARRLDRDIVDRGRDIPLIIQQWDKFVKPNYELHIKHTMRNADIVVPRGLENTIGIDMLTNHIKRQLAQKSKAHVRDIMQLDDVTEDNTCNDSIIQLAQTNQVRAIHTIISNQSTGRDQFKFYFDRVASILVTKALDELGGQDMLDIANTMVSHKPVTTPVDVTFDGVSFNFDNVTAVTLIRGGECFQHALRDAVPTMRIGKLLVQADSRTGEPQLHARSLPPCLDPKPQGPEGRLDADAIKELHRSKVILCDGQIFSGGALIVAVAVLLDHGLDITDIVVVAYAASRIGISRILFAHPQLKIVVARIDEEPTNHFIDVLYYGT